MKTTAILLSIIFFCNISEAQLFAGASYGTYNVPGISTGPFKGLSPAVHIVYMPDGIVGSQFFVNGSAFTEHTARQPENVYDPLGNLVGSSVTEISYHIKQLQTGFHGVIGSRDEERKVPKFFAGGGAAFMWIRNVYTYELNGNKTASDTDQRWLYGFHFNAGLQYHVKPVLIRLQGNFDFMLSQIESNSQEQSGYFVFGTKLGALIPLTRSPDNKKVNTKAKPAKRSNNQAIKPAL